jgi:hypothetical protein
LAQHRDVSRDLALFLAAIFFDSASPLQINQMLDTSGHVNAHAARQQMACSCRLFSYTFK